MIYPKTITIDLETTGLDPWHDKIILISYRFDAKGPTFTFDTSSGDIRPSDLLSALANPSVTKRGHNVHFDLLFLEQWGFPVIGPVDDTRILAYLENPQQELNLKTLVEKKLKRGVVRMEDFGTNRLSKKAILRHPLLVSRLVKSGKYWVSKKTLIGYNVADVINCDDLRRELVATNWYKEVEQPLAGIIFKTEKRGIQLDIPHLENLKNELSEKIQEVKKKLGAGENFNPASPKQVLAKFRESGHNLESSDKHTLKLLSWKGNDFASNILKFRGYSKLLGTYVEPFLEQNVDGRLHGRFNQAGRESESLGDIKGTATGRLSSSDPNLQNIPDRTEEGRKVRQAFIATPGMILIDSDLKQIEPRLVAHFTQSPKLLDSFAKGTDTHAVQGGLIFNKRPEDLTKLERFIGKTSWLATMYGAWYKKLKLIAEVNSEDPLPYDEEFYEKVQKAFWQANPEISQWRSSFIAETRAQGSITTIGGRSILIPGLSSRNEWERNQAERLAVNYLIQGSAADVMKLITVRVDKEWPGTQLAWIHDEILAEHPLESHEIAGGHLKHIMENTVRLKNVQIEADTKIIKSWSEK